MQSRNMIELTPGKLGTSVVCRLWPVRQREQLENDRKTSICFAVIGWRWWSLCQSVRTTPGLGCGSVSTAKSHHGVHWIEIGWIFSIDTATIVRLYFCTDSDNPANPEGRSPSLSYRDRSKSRQNQSLNIWEPRLGISPHYPPVKEGSGGPLPSPPVRGDSWLFLPGLEILRARSYWWYSSHLGSFSLSGWLGLETDIHGGGERPVSYSYYNNLWTWTNSLCSLTKDTAHCAPCSSYFDPLSSQFSSYSIDQFDANFGKDETNLPGSDLLHGSNPTHTRQSRRGWI